MKKLVENKLNFYNIENIESAIDKIVAREKRLNTSIYIAISIISVLYILATGIDNIWTTIGMSCFAVFIFMSAMTMNRKSFKSYSELILDDDGYKNIFKYISSISFIEKIVDKEKMSKDKRPLDEINISKIKVAEYKVARDMVEELLIRYVFKVATSLLIVLEIVFTILGIIYFDTASGGTLSFYLNVMIVYPVSITLLFTMCYGLIIVHFDKNAYKFTGNKIKEFYEGGLIDGRYYKIILDVSEDYRNDNLIKTLK